VTVLLVIVTVAALAAGVPVTPETEQPPLAVMTGMVLALVVAETVKVD
jgi:hypothetical protein